jgi:hypothetical protein
MTKICWSKLKKNLVLSHPHWLEDISDMNIFPQVIYRYLDIMQFQQIL